MQEQGLKQEKLILKIRHLNIDKAIDRFLANVELVDHLPLVTDEDVSRLYGEEVAQSLEDLALYNKHSNICQDCSNKCCSLVNCELYHQSFSQCPIYPYRPAICRMHFCEKFPVGDISFIREFADIFLNSLIEARHQGSLKALLFDCPPLIKLAPDLVIDLSPWITAVKAGIVNEARARSSICSEVEKLYPSVVQ